MNLALALLRLLNPFARERKVIHYLGCGLVMVQPASLNADGYYRSSSCYSYPVREKVIVKEVQKVVYALQTIPLYSLAYSPAAYTSSYAMTVAAPQKTEYYAQPYALPVVYQQPYQQYAPQQIVQKQTHALSCDEKLEAFRLEIRKEIRAALLAEQPERMPLTANGGHVGILSAKCASCHSENPKNNDFVMFRGGQFEQLDIASVGKIGVALSLGEMPKNGSPKLTDAEFATVQKWVKAKMASAKLELKAPPPPPDPPAKEDGKEPPQ